MKVGKVPENVLKRSVFKQIHTMRPEVVLGAGVGEDCAAVQLAEDETLVMSTDPITGTAKDIGTLAIQITVNDLASAGAEPVGVLITVLLPTSVCEQDLCLMMKQVEEACAKANVQVMGGHTEVTRVVNQPVISVCGVGKVKKGHLISTAGARPGMDILVSKWIGIEGTSIIAKEKEEELKQEQRQKKDKILPSHIAQVVAKWTHIPVEQMEEAEKERLKKLDAILHERVVGQNDAVKAVARAIRRGRVGLNRT